MHAVTRQGIEENGQCRRQRLTFTGEHLGNFTLMQNCAAKKLHIEVHHIPHRFIAAGHPMIMIYSLIANNIHKIMRSSQFAIKISGRHLDVFVVRKAFCRTFHNGKSFGSDQIQLLLVYIQHLFF